MNLKFAFGYQFYTMKSIELTKYYPLSQTDGNKVILWHLLGGNTSPCLSASTKPPGPGRQGQELFVSMIHVSNALFCDAYSTVQSLDIRIY